MYYNLPNSTTIGFVEIAKYVNSALDVNNTFPYIFTLGLLLFVFAIMIVYLSHAYKPEEALAVSGYVCTLISMVLFYAGLLGSGIVLVFVVCAMAGTFYAWWHK